MAGGVEVGHGYVTISASARDAVRQVERDFTGSMPAVGDKAGKGLSSGFLASAGKIAGPLAALFAVDKIKDFFVDANAEARESQKVGATTTAIIKSTGGAAKITADQVGELATAISNKSGMDDEAIQKGANLLLTFKNVRNEAGEGANVFDRATQSAVDLSAAGFGSVEGASKMLGKALNDPVKGITALQRAGVTFTDQQKEQIKTLVASGKGLEAQKIILKEVESQVGGVAAASATSGEKLTVAFANFKEQIGTALLPLLDRFFGFLTTKGIPALSRLVAYIGANAPAAFARILPPIRSVIAEFVRNWPQIRPVVVGVMKAIGGVVTSVMGLIAAVTKRRTGETSSVVGVAFRAIAGIVRGAMNVVSGVIRLVTALITGDWKKAGAAIIQIVKGLATVVMSIIRNLPIVKTFQTMLGKARDAFKVGADAIGRAWDAIKEKAKAPVRFVINTVLNDGLIAGFNKVAGFVGAGKIGRLSLPGFHAGGWTGPGAKMQPAGVVHADEFVINKRSRGKIEQQYPGFLDQLNGYAGGGLVGGSGHFSPLFAGVLKLAQKMTGHQLAIYQRGFRPATSYSGTSHRGDAIDARVDNTLLRTLRALGVAIWDRTGKGNWAPHMHGVPLPGRGFAGGSGVWQAMDYLRGGDGLGGRDNGPRVGVGANIAAFIKAGFNSASDWLKDLLSKPLAKLREIGNSPFAQLVAKFPRRIADAMMDKVKGYAGGTGYASPGWAAVAENGPELVTRPSYRMFRGGERVHTAGQTAGMGATVNQYFPTTATPRSAADAAGGRVVMALSGMGI